MISELQKKLRDDLNSESGTTEKKPESGQIISHWQSQDPIPSPRAPQIRSDRRIKQKKKSLHKVNNATAVLPAQGLKEETTGVKCINFGEKVTSICSAEMQRSRGNDTTEQTFCKNKVRGHRTWSLTEPKSEFKGTMKSFSDWPKSHLLTCLVYLWYTNDRIIGKKEELTVPSSLLLKLKPTQSCI